MRDVMGIDLARSYYTEVVAPILGEQWPQLSYAAGRLGTGSDVVGFDDEVSRDHDWGLRLSLFVSADAVDWVTAGLDARLPESFRGHPTRFTFTATTEPHHHVEVSTVGGFLVERLGFDPREPMTTHDWLSLSGQAVLEVTAGPVFVDEVGDLTAARRLLAWYPDDIWRYVLGCDWQRISQELPLMGRAADASDDRGSRVIAARVAHAVMHLAFMVERQWPPYAKWLGSAFDRLPCASAVGEALDRALSATAASDRQQAIADALQWLLERQNALGVTTVGAATIPFWNRPYLHPDPAIAAELLNGIGDPEVRRLPLGLGSIEQRTDNVDILVNPVARRAMVAPPQNMSP
jgi:hypothetical protein